MKVGLDRVAGNSFADSALETYFQSMAAVFAVLSISDNLVDPLVRHVSFRLGLSSLSADSAYKGTPFGRDTPERAFFAFYRSFTEHRGWHPNCIRPETFPLRPP